MYSAFEATLTPALPDNVSYSFMTGGFTYKPSFIDVKKEREWMTRMAM